MSGLGAARARKPILQRRMKARFALLVREGEMPEKTCPECNGQGVVDEGTEDERRCPTCNGSGVVPDDEQDSEEVWNTEGGKPQAQTSAAG